MSSPLPVAVCGKILSHLALVTKALAPEYDGEHDQTRKISDIAQLIHSQVTHIFYNVEVFVRTFPSIEQKPVAIFMGGGFDQTEFEVAHSVPGAASIAWFRPSIFKPGNEHMLGKGPPTARAVVDGARKALGEREVVLREGKGAGEVWYYG